MPLRPPIRNCIRGYRGNNCNLRLDPFNNMAGQSMHEPSLSRFVSDLRKIPYEPSNTTTSQLKPFASSNTTQLTNKKLARKNELPKLPIRVSSPGSVKSLSNSDERADLSAAPRLCKTESKAFLNHVLTPTTKGDGEVILPRGRSDKTKEESARQGRLRPVQLRHPSRLSLKGVPTRYPGSSNENQLEKPCSSACLRIPRGNL